MTPRLYNLISYYLYKFSSQTKLHKQLSEAYKDREWVQFDSVLNQAGKTSVIHRYWSAMKSSYFMRLDNATQEWEEIHKSCRKSFHFLSQFAFRNYIYSLISSEDLDKLKRELFNFQNLYGNHCPLLYLPGICALFVKAKEYNACLDFLNNLKILIYDEKLLQEFNLKSYPYYWICKYNTGVEDEMVSKGLSEGLKEKMQDIYLKDSPAFEVLSDCLNCWEAIKSTNSEILADMRYNHDQALMLKNKIEQALKDKEPFLLLRLGDGEAYAFAEDSKKYRGRIVSTLEDFWWGTKLTSDIRDQIIKDFKSTFKAADVVGLPYTIRLSQTLTRFLPEDLSYSDIRQKVLFNGVENYLRKNNDMQCSLWTDEYCNYSLVKKKDISKLIDLAANVVLVTCFNIPKDNIFNHSKVETVIIPPVKKVSFVDDVISHQKSLPEIVNDLKNEIEPKLQEGTLLLLSGGFAGKPILKLAKDKGAVAIDFGSSIDHIMGYRTRNLELHILFDD